jgi:hypothetical protein
MNHIAWRHAIGTQVISTSFFIGYCRTATVLA